MIVELILMILLAVVTAAIFTLRRAVKADTVASLLKVLASVCFILLGYFTFQNATGTVSAFILAGLLMGLVGDIYLDLKYVHPRSETIYTFVGFGAFMVGHIFYLIFLLRQYGFIGTGFIISIIIGILAGVGIYFVTPQLMHLNYGRFRLVSACYAALLVFLTIYALSLCCSGFQVSRLLFFLGILLFLFSDLVLSQIYFGENKNTPQYTMVNLASYYLGQILIALSVFFIA